MHRSVHNDIDNISVSTYPANVTPFTAAFAQIEILIADLGSVKHSN